MTATGLKSVITENTLNIAKNTTAQLIGKIISVAITVGATIIITRSYGREAYGDFNLMQAFPGLFFIIADFGLNAIVAREITKHPELEQKYFSNTLLLRILISVTLMIFGLFIVKLRNYAPQLELGINLSLLLIATQALLATTNIIFQTKKRLYLATISNLIGYIAILLLIIILAKANASVIWVNFAYVIGGVISLIFAIYKLKQLGVLFKLEFDLPLIKRLLVATLPLGLMFVFSQINFKIDTLLLDAASLPESFGLNRAETLAIYGLAYKIFEVALVIPTFFMNAAYPRIIEKSSSSKEELRQVMFKVLGSMAILGLAATLGILITAPILITIIGGNNFILSIYALRLLALGLPIFFLTQPLSWLIVTLEKQNYLPKIYFLVALTNLLLNIHFIPLYSYKAAAVITWLCELLVLGLLTYYAKKSWKEYYTEQI
ncbi:flippase [candidate division WWE3 bacterium]|uniref:Flippase n=1 Tax=candidate division WWE3 bacterium TaxID=2053526 RepID=A0A955J1S9_UNCKA|nr:flippase [candidate division WWE3 bacterium]